MRNPDRTYIDPSFPYEDWVLDSLGENIIDARDHVMALQGDWARCQRSVDNLEGPYE